MVHTISVITYVEAEVWTVAKTDQGNAVLVRPKHSEVAVPIFIGQLEIQSILIGIGKVEVPRPLTHDLLASAIAATGSSVSRIEICDLKEGTFYAQLVVETPTLGRVSVDSRPSDALALAIRLGCPIFIAEFIVDEAGIPVSLITEAKPSGDIASGADEDESAEAGDEEALLAKDRGEGTEIRHVREALDRAVADENYEEAAELRDLLRKLEEGEGG